MRIHVIPNMRIHVIPNVRIHVIPNVRNDVIPNVRNSIDVIGHSSMPFIDREWLINITTVFERVC